MENRKKPVTIAGVLTVSSIGAVMMMGVDLEGTRWLKFVLYLLFLASISIPAVFSSSFSYSSMLRRPRR